MNKRSMIKLFTP